MLDVQRDLEARNRRKLKILMVPHRIQFAAGCDSAEKYDVDQGRAKESDQLFGRPKGFGSSERDEIVDFHPPDRGRDRKTVIFWTSRGIWKLGMG